MDQVQRLEIFKAQVRNVRALRSAMRQVHRSANRALRLNDKASSEAFTRIYAMLFCAWAEANFSKVIHTPYGFTLDEIDQINHAKTNGISVAWKKCVELGAGRLDAKRGRFKPNTIQTLNSAIDSHVLDPSLIRNKLAHGQWVAALNRDNTALNPEMTNSLNQLNLTHIGGWIECHQILADIVEHLIESPKKTFVRDWYRYVLELEERMKAAEERTLQDHIAKLLDKDQRTGAAKKRSGQ